MEQLAASEPAFREQLRMHAAEGFERGEDNTVVAYELVRGHRSRRRLSVAALVCYKPGHRPRLI